MGHLGEQGVGSAEDLLTTGIAFVETTGDDAGLLDVRQLVATPTGTTLPPQNRMSAAWWTG